MNYAAFRAILTLSATDNMSRTVNAAIGNAQTRMAKFGARAQGMGRDMMMGGGIIAAPFVAATKAAVDFEEAFTGVTKTWRGTETELENTRKGILAMSRSAQNTATAEELSAIAESAGQLGIQTKNVLTFTKTIADLKATTNLGDEAAPQFAKFANITRMPQERFSNLASTVVELGNNMATTEADIVNFGMRIAGAGAQVNIPQSKIMGLAAGLSSVGLEAEAGGTAISKTLIELSNRVKTGGAGLAEVAGISGMSGAAFAKSFQEDAAGATVSFIEGLGKIKQEGGNVFQTLDKLGMGEIRLRDTLLRASGAGDLLRKSLNLSSTAWDKNEALTKEAETRYKTTASQMKVFKNNVTALAITVGNAIIPALTSMVGVLQSVTTWVADVSERYPRLTKIVAIGTAAFGAFLVVGGAIAYTIGTVSRIVSAATGVLNAFGGITKIVTAAQWLWNVALAANPIGAVIIAVVALGAAITGLVLYWDELKAAFQESPTWVKVVIGIFAWINKPILAIIGGIAFLIRNWNDLPGATGRAIKGMGQWLLSIVPMVARTVGQILWFVATLPVKIPLMLWDAVTAAGSAVMAAAPALWQSVQNVFGNVLTFIGSIPGRMFEAGKNIIMSITDGILSVATAPLDAISGIVSGIRDFLPFSPAKVGPLRDIHRVKIVETIADGMKPAPMVSAMQSVVGATVGVGGAVRNPANSGGGSVVVNFAPTVNVTGTGTGEDIRAQIMAMGPEMVAYLERALARKMAGGFAG